MNHFYCFETVHDCCGTDRSITSEIGHDDVGSEIVNSSRSGSSSSSGGGNSVSPSHRWSIDLSMTYVSGTILATAITTANEVVSDGQLPPLYTPSHTSSPPLQGGPSFITIPLSTYTHIISPTHTSLSPQPLPLAFSTLTLCPTRW